MVKKGDMLSKEDIESILALEIVGAIPDSEEVIAATNRGVPIVLDGTYITKNYENIAQRIRGEEVPLEEDLKSSPNKGLLSFFKNLFGRKG